MTMFELGKCQKLSGEMKLQMDAMTVMNANLMAQVKQLTDDLAVSEFTPLT